MINELARIMVLAFGMIVQPSAAPAPQTSAPLKEIEHIRVTSPLCKTLVGHATRAIDIETENDVRLAVAERTLQTLDFDGSEQRKFQSIAEVTRQYVALRAEAVRGGEMMRAFRQDAATASSDEQRADLATFADSLAGALHRQQVLADDVGRLIAYLDAHPPIDKDAHDRLVFEAIFRRNMRGFTRTPFDHGFGPNYEVPDPLGVTASNASLELISRGEPIKNDEAVAAERIDAAFARC